ncbi:MAG: ribose 5-phosphate isomerase B [Nanoarchaeota archaeon]
MGKEVIYIGADHSGFQLKERIKEYLGKNKIQYEDLGGRGDKNDDYPDYAFKVAEKVSKNKNSKGILVCGTGTGMVIAANKVKSIRAAFAYDSYSARASREHNNANILCLRGRNFQEKKNLQLVKIWLSSVFSGKSRHERRLRKIVRYEI